MEKRNKKEIESLFKKVRIEPHEDWNVKRGNKNMPKKYYTDKAQMNDKLYNIVSEVQQPETMREVLKDWRYGAETRFKMPYHPDAKKPSAYFNYF